MNVSFFFFFVFSLFPPAISYIHMETKNIPLLECGEILKDSGTLILPGKVECSFKVEVGSNVRAILEILSTRGESVDCEKMIMTDDETGEEFSFCPSFVLNGTSSSYTLTLNSLERDVMFSVSFVPRGFHCPGDTKSGLVDLPFTITTSHGNECHLRLYSMGTLTLKVINQSTAPSHECQNQVEVMQGRNIERLMSSGVHCLDDVIETDLYCGTHSIRLLGPPMVLEAKIVPFSGEKRREIFYKKYECPF